jgi:hypothetical protein
LGFTVRYSVLLVSVLVAIAGGLVACSNTTNGSAVPGDNPTGGETTTGGRSSPNRTTPRPNSGNSPTEDIKPCSLLTDAEQAQLKLTGEEERRVGSARTCRWRQPDAGGVNVVFDVAIYDNAGIKDLPPGTTINQLADIGSHKAVQVPANAGDGCAVILGVTDSSRVVNNVVAADQQKSCDLALQTARLVEPKLPRG